MGNLHHVSLSASLPGGDGSHSTAMERGFAPPPACLQPRPPSFNFVVFVVVEVGSRDGGGGGSGAERIGGAPCERALLT